MAVEDFTVGSPVCAALANGHPAGEPGVLQERSVYGSRKVTEGDLVQLEITGVPVIVELAERYGAYRCSRLDRTCSRL